MDSKLLQRVMDLAEKTGDRIIVVNPKNGTAHAVMSFDAYEKLVSNTASLRDLDDEFDFSDEMESDENEEECLICKETGIDLDDLRDDDERTEIALNDQTPSVEELNRIAQDALEKDKKAKDSQKEIKGPAPLDVLEDEEGEEQYYLEPLE